MAGRNAKPVHLHIAEGNPNRLTKAEIKRRQESEIKLGGKRLKCPDYVKADPVALKKWRELVKEYTTAKSEGVDLVKSSDIGILARYCKTFSEYMNLLEHRDRISNIEIEPEESDIVTEALELRFGTRRANKIFEKVEYILSVAGIINLETAINKKMDMLIKMEDRLFLHPLSKVKNIPKKEPEKKDPLKEKGFGNV